MQCFCVGKTANLVVIITTALSQRDGSVSANLGGMELACNGRFVAPTMQQCATFSNGKNSGDGNKPGNPLHSRYFNFLTGFVVKYAPRLWEASLATKWPSPESRVPFCVSKTALWSADLEGIKTGQFAAPTMQQCASCQVWDRQPINPQHMSYCSVSRKLSKWCMRNLSMTPDTDC